MKRLSTLRLKTERVKKVSPVISVVILSGVRCTNINKQTSERTPRAHYSADHRRVVFLACLALEKREENKVINQSINQSINQPNDKYINPSIEKAQSINQSINSDHGQPF